MSPSCSKTCSGYPHPTECQSPCNGIQAPFRCPIAFLPFPVTHSIKLLTLVEQTFYLCLSKRLLGISYFLYLECSYPDFHIANFLISFKSFLQSHHLIEAWLNIPIEKYNLLPSMLNLFPLVSSHFFHSF